MIKEMMPMGIKCDGLYDRFVSLVEKPKIHVASEQRTAASTIDREFGPTFVRDVFKTCLSSTMAPSSHKRSTMKQWGIIVHC